MKAREEIQTWLQQRIATELQVDPTTVPLNTPFIRYGFDSVVVVTLSVDLEEWLGVSLDPTVFWEYPDITTLTDWLVTEHLPSQIA